MRLPTKRVMIVEHYASLRDGLVALLESERDIQIVSTESTAVQALAAYLRLKPDVVVVDVDLGEALDFIRRIRLHDRETMVITLVGYEWEAKAQAAFAASGYAGLPKDQISRRLLSLIRTGPIVV